MEQKIKEFVSENQQIVYDLIMEFHNIRNNLIIDDEYLANYSGYVMNHIKSAAKNTGSGLNALSYLFQLREIVSTFILINNFSEAILIELISKNYFKRIYTQQDFFVYGIPYEEHKDTGYWIGIEDFIDYKNALITERDIFGFKNLAIIYEKDRKRFSE